MDYKWADQAACKDLDLDMFFPERHVEVEAWKICTECPVRIECLTFAIENKIEYGIWGGFGLRARRRIQKRSKQEAKLNATG